MILEPGHTHPTLAGLVSELVVVFVAAAVVVGTAGTLDVRQIAAS